jgi:hypothetical protein
MRFKALVFGIFQFKEIFIRTNYSSLPLHFYEYKDRNHDKVQSAQGTSFPGAKPEVPYSTPRRPIDYTTISQPDLRSRSSLFDHLRLVVERFQLLESHRGRSNFLQLPSHFAPS